MTLVVPRPTLESVRKSSQKKRRDVVTEIIERIKPYNPETIILFGSRARGQSWKGSDVDLLIVKETAKPTPERIGDVLELVYPSNTPPGAWPTCGVDIVVYTPKELRDRIQRGDFFIRQILRDGKALYGAKTRARR